MFLVDEVNHHVRRDNHKVEQVRDQNVVEAMHDDLRRDASQVAGDNEQGEGKAHALGAVRLDVADKGERPGKSEADQHNRFQKLTHCLFLLLRPA